MSKKKYNQIKKHTSSLAASVLQRIENESITPSAWWKFACVNCLVWIAWVVTIVCGAISVSVLAYVSNRARFELYEATHDSFLLFLIDILPMLWMFSFFVMIVLAYVNMRHTKCGYKYPLWKMLGSSVVLSIAGGAALHFFGVGYYMDTQFAQKIPMYTSLQRTEQHMWQQPHTGRLLGVFTETDDQRSNFIDVENEHWEIITDALAQKDMELFTSGKKVRVLGTTTSLARHTLYACGVFPWMYDDTVTNDEMRKEKEDFIQRMYRRMEADEQEEEIEDELYTFNKESTTTKNGKKGICTDIIPMKRFRK